LILNVILIKATNPSTTFNLFVSKVSTHTIEMCENCELEANGAMQLLGHGMALPRSTSENTKMWKTIDDGFSERLW